MSVNWVGVLIIAAVAGLLFASSEIAGLADASLTILSILIIAAIAIFAYNYFRQNELAWLVMKPWQRWLIIASGLGIAALVVGFGFFVDVLSFLGVIALIAVLALVIAWVIRESRRFRI